MSETARLEILKMLNEGKITAEQAAEMIRLLSDGSSSSSSSSSSSVEESNQGWFGPRKPKPPARKIRVTLDGRAIKDGPVEYTVSLGFLNTVRSFTDMIPAVRRVIMWDTLNLVGGELADIRISMD